MNGCDKRGTIDIMNRINRRVLKIPAILLFLLMMCSGCAGFGRTIETPRVKLADITVKEVRGFETVFTVTLRIFNTNDIPLEIKGVECDIELNKKHFATGLSSTGTEIPSFDTGILSIDVYSSVLDMVANVLELVKKSHHIKTIEKMDYKLHGEIRLGNSHFGPSSIPFTSKGEISLKGITDFTDF